MSQASEFSRKMPLAATRGGSNPLVPPPSRYGRIAAGLGGRIGGCTGSGGLV
jgi:hypothetical protein